MLTPVLPKSYTTLGPLQVRQVLGAPNKPANQGTPSPSRGRHRGVFRLMHFVKTRTLGRGLWSCIAASVVRQPVAVSSMSATTHSPTKSFPNSPIIHSISTLSHYHIPALPAGTHHRPCAAARFGWMIGSWGDPSQARHSGLWLFQVGKGKGNATAVLLRRNRDTGPAFLDARNAQGTECSTGNFLRLFVIVIRCIEYYTTYLTV